MWYKSIMMKTTESQAPAMNPSAYTHFLAKFDTAHLRNLETREKMESEGACPEVLEAIDRATQALDAARDAIRLARLIREDEMKIARSESAAAREADAAKRKAEALARKASKASAPKGSPATAGVPSNPALRVATPVEAGPEGPSVTAS
jgi:hypothetical protein